MWLIPVLTLCLAATAIFDLVVALFGLLLEMNQPRY